MYITHSLSSIFSEEWPKNNNFFFKKIYRSSGQSFRNGTCLTNAECLEMGGASSGSCAGGWLFIINYI